MLTGYPTPCMNPTALLADGVLAAGRCGASNAHQFYSARLSCLRTRFGVIGWGYELCTSRLGRQRQPGDSTQPTTKPVLVLLQTFG